MKVAVAVDTPDVVQVVVQVTATLGELKLICQTLGAAEHSGRQPEWKLRQAILHAVERVSQTLCERIEE